MRASSQIGAADARVEDVLAHVRRIEITTRRAVDEALGGRYRSAFRGRGIDFDQVREYVPGDEVRAIDWHVTARAGRPFVKEFTEERQLQVIIAVDVSASGEFGSSERSARDVAAEIAAALAFSALANGDRVGLLLFADEVEHYVPSGKGRSHALRIIRDVLTHTPRGRCTNIAHALDHLGRVVRRRAVVFLVSDFAVHAPAGAARADAHTKLRDALALAHARHDVVAVHVRDARRDALPDVGVVTLEDAETGELVTVNTSRRSVRERFAAAASRERDEIACTLAEARIDEILVSTDGEYAPALAAFFAARERRLR
jgi:uncharacterized protein (DUF58 family)